jgi:hypothetical protein
MKAAGEAPRICKGRRHRQSQRGNQKKFLHIYPLL